jgi:hypothetical protein
MDTINAHSMTAATSFTTPAAISLQQKAIKTASGFVVVFPNTRFPLLL